MKVDWTASPTSSKEVALRLLGSAATSDIYWDFVWLYKEGALRLELPTYVSEVYQTPSIFKGVPRQAGLTTNTWDALSLEFVELERGEDYWLVANQPDANPNAVIFKNSTYFDYPLFTLARRPFSDLTTFTAVGTETTTAELHRLVPRVKMILLERVLLPRFPNDPKWKSLYVKAALEWKNANVARPLPSVARTKPFWTPFPLRA